MKRNILYLTTILLGLMLGSCSLEEDPKFAYYPKPVFNSETTTTATITEGYGHLASLYSEMILIPTTPNGTMVSRVTTKEVSRASSYDIDPTGNDLTKSYLALYKMINNSNTIIAGLENSTLSEGYKKTAVAHAHFIRGYAYYLLGTLWGRAPIQLTPVGDKASINRPLSSRKEVYAQAESDWLIAAEKLPEGSPIGLANKNVANAYLAKLYFMLASQKQAGLETSNYSSANEIWNKVVEYGEKVNGKDYLDPDYASLFGPGVSNSPEIIFQLNYTSYEEKGIRKSWNHLFGPYFYTYYSALTGNTDAYRMVVMDRAFYDYQAGSHPYDSRMKTIYLTDFLEKKYNKKTENKRRVVSYPFVLDGNTNDSEIINGRDFMLPNSDPKNPEYNFNDNSNAKWNVVKKKWTSVKDTDGRKYLFPYSGKGANVNAFGQYDSNDVILFRNADLLLILADAYNELGKTSQANDYIQLILNRATRANGRTPEKVPVMTQQQRRDYIFFERMFELAGEPVVFEDVRRRGTEYLKKVIEIHNNSHFINYRYNLEKEKKSTIEYRAIIINDKNLDESFLKKNLLLPIPQAEITQNENISQADQNFGYN